jgi:hypothetical protein
MPWGKNYSASVVLIKHLKKSGTLNQGTIVEVTVAQKLNQGYFPKWGVIDFGAPFFSQPPIPVAYFGEAKK